MGFLAALLLSFFLAAATSSAQDCVEASYEFTFVDELFPNRPFVLSITHKDSLAMKSLEPYLDQYGNIEDEGDGLPSINVVAGKIRKVTPEDKHPDHAWGFAWIPESVEFNDFALISCDADFRTIEAHFDEWMQKRNGLFCPWRSKSMLRKVKKKCLINEQNF